MKFNQAIHEMAQFEFGPRGTKRETASANALEIAIVKAIEKAFEISPELKAKFGAEQEPFDIQITKQGPNFRIVSNPEDGSKSSTATYPMTYLAKYIGNPKGMAMVLLTR